ncbi:Oxygen-independent coproporphyrinogen-III oxidase 1 [Planctomycetales bacterium 10988]|nr:Oxygen-independent coproporphyrinogen-III oxidase 1 [Planctomycetales bacterium 10988]
MASIQSPSTERSWPDWKAAGYRYFPYSFYLKQLFGHRVHRISLDGGFTCPNVDGTVAKGGCVFCDNRSFSPSRRVRRTEIFRQIDDGIRRVKMRYKVDDFLAYFQPATNTYAPIEKLRPLYETALEHPQISGLCIGTRPDCVPDEVLDLLEELAQEHYVAVEYGIQTMHDKSLDWMNRGHHVDVFYDAIERSRGRGFEIGTHLILGLPNESTEEMHETAEKIAALDLDSVKIHNLYVVEHTPLADWVREGSVQLMELEDYVEMVVDVIERLPPRMVIERVSGEAPPKYLVAPEWCLDKPNIHKLIKKRFEERDTWQGKRFEDANGVESRG